MAVSTSATTGAVATQAASTTGAPQILSSQQVATMTPAQRADYFNSLSAQDRASAMDQYESFRVQQNAHYLAACIDKLAVCPPVGAAGATSATYAFGNTLLYDVPTAEGAFAKEILLECNIQLSMAAGTGATYALNPSAPYSLFSYMAVLYNGMLHRIPLQFFKYYELFRGYTKNQPGIIVAGNSDANVQNAVWGTFGVASGTNTWTFYIRVPLNAIHPHSAAGCLPIMGQSTKMQIQLVCAAQGMGNDPFLNATYALAGTGNAVTVGATATVKAVVVYNDGDNYDGPSKLALDLSGEPALQYVWDQPLTNLTSNNQQRSRITTLMQHHMVLAIVIDGQALGKYATIANITEMALTKDQVGQNVLKKYGTGTNLAVTDFFWHEIRRKFGQDIPDEGAIPWIISWAGYPDPDNMEGIQALNMTSGGWTDVYHEYTLTQVGTVAGINPRVELMVLSLNPQGLIKG